jgi:hypothetical protein
MVTKSEIEKAKTPGGGWTRKQLAQWGVPWPPPKGWKRRLVEESKWSGGDREGDEGNKDSD